VSPLREAEGYTKIASAKHFFVAADDRRSIGLLQYFCKTDRA